MKKLFIILSLILTFSVSAQVGTYEVKDTLKLANVPLGTSNDSIVLINSEGKLFHFPQSSLVPPALTLQSVIEADSFVSFNSGRDRLSLLGDNGDNKSIEWRMVDTSFNGTLALFYQDLLEIQNSTSTKRGDISISDGVVDITQSNVTTGNETSLQFVDPIAVSIIKIPAKPTGTYTLATTDIINNIPQANVTNLVTDLANKQATLVSGTNIKTINGTSLLGSEDIVISGGGSVPNGTLRTLGSGTFTSTLQKVSDNLNVASPLLISSQGVSATGNPASHERNTVFGLSAGTAIMSSSDENAFYGFLSGNVSTADGNSGFGAKSLLALTTGYSNTSVGYSSGSTITTGNNNCIFGSTAGTGLISGSNNIVIGSNSHRTAATGDTNIIIGHNSGPLSSGSNYNVIMGSIPPDQAAVLQNNIIIADGQGNRKLVINQANLATIPLQTTALIKGDATGKAILTKEYLGTRIGTVAPASATSTGTVGEIRVAGGFIYWCTATNVWIRAAGATF